MNCSKDCWFCILSLCDIISFIRFSVVSKYFAALCEEWLGCYKSTLHGYWEKSEQTVVSQKGWRNRVRQAFTCPCGRVKWNIRRHCDCFVLCTLCGRSRPYEKVVVRTWERGSRCTYQCVFTCGSCSEILDMNDIFLVQWQPVKSFVVCKNCVPHWANGRILTPTNNELAFKLLSSQWKEYSQPMKLNEDYVEELRELMKVNDPDNNIIDALARRR